MDYNTIYNNIIIKAKSENRKKKNGVYYENHHIIPRCLGGLNSKDNTVLLTAREHFICHKILFYTNKNNKKLALAYHSLSYAMQDKRNIRLTSREYEEIRLACSMATSGKNNPRYGVKIDQHIIDAMEKGRKNSKGTLGMRHTEDAKAKMSKNRKGINLGVKKSIETRKKMSLYWTGRVSVNKGKVIQKNRKPIGAICPLGIYHEFDSATELFETHGVSQRNVCSALKGKAHTVKGWSNFKYIENVQTS